MEPGSRNDERMTSESRDARDDLSVDDHDVAERAALLPEERAAGSDDPHAQAEAILAESAERTEHPDPDASTQTGRRKPEETT